MKKCPYCAEEIQDEAIKCRYCGERLEEPKEVAVKECTICGQLNKIDAIQCVNPRCRNKISPKAKIRSISSVVAKALIPEVKKEIEKKRTNREGIGCLVVIILFIIAISQCSRIQAPKGNGEEIEAYVAATTFVEEKLETPATAKFPLCTNAYTKYLGDKHYRVSSYVDAQNAYGALVRIHFTCVVEHIGGEGDKWVLVSIDME